MEGFQMNHHPTTPHPTRVKIIARGQPSHPWASQSPGGKGHWGTCQFLFERHETAYDWLVVIDDVSRKLKTPPERLSCPRENTILVTTEPPTITRYGKAFASQFHTLITSQDKASLPHQNRIHSATGNLWFHGKTYDELLATPPLEKPLTLSTVCSSKQQKHTAHHARYDFTQWLKTRIPQLDIFGHGVRRIEKKHEALDPYRFHLAIENHLAPHHWTEKFADPILSLCVPIYHGCPNLPDYFPKDSYISIDIRDPENALDTILREINDPESYPKRIPALIEARNLILNKYNLLAMLNQHIQQAGGTKKQSSPHRLFGRKQMRLISPSDLASHLTWKGSHLLRTLRK